MVFSVGNFFYSIELFIVPLLCSCFCLILDLYSYLTDLVRNFPLLFSLSFILLEGFCIIHLCLKILINGLFISN